MRKINYLAIAAGVLALVSLSLPWFSVNNNLIPSGITVLFTAYLYQIVGTANGASQTISAAIWFAVTAIAFLALSAVCAFAGSFIAGKKGKLLIYITGILSILSIVVFALGLFSSDFVGSNGFEYTLSHFSNNLGLTAEQINGTHRSTFSVDMIGYGMWLALVAGIIAFAAIIMHPAVPVTIATDPKPTDAPAE
jgi:hypothetical protein